MTPPAQYLAPQWVDATVAAEHWADVPALAPSTFQRLATVATVQARAYAPVLDLLTVVPDNYVLAVIYQARDLWNAIQRGETDVIGVGDYALRARPLSAAVKSMLRPASGLPPIG